MNIIVLSNTPWADDNSFGNSYSNIFDGIPDLHFANIYCRYGQPDNQFDMRFFQITEKSLIKNLKNKNDPSGFQVFPDKNNGDELGKREEKGFDQARKMRWQIMFWGRNLIWKIGRWNSIQLRMFLDDFKPDLIFQPVYIKPYINDIALFMKEYIGCPMIGYISDDNYTLKQFNLSPLYWIDRLWSRRKVKAVIEKCELLYVISEIQKEEYEKIFTPPCKVLTKCADFTAPAPEWEMPTGEVKLVYAGNLGSGRWQSLGYIAKAIEALWCLGYEVKLDVYTSTPMSRKMEQILMREGTTIHKSVSYDEILRIQKNADIVLHVEGVSKSSQMAVHQSFSTKLVDYFAMGKCILAVGTEYEASIKHLLDNDAAVVIGAEKEAVPKLKHLLDTPKLILEYGAKAYECGRKHHEKAKIQKMITEDMQIVLNKINIEEGKNNG